MTDETSTSNATATPPAEGTPPNLVTHSPIIATHAALSKEWRRLTRVATLIAIVTSPSVFYWFHHHNGWSVGKSLVLTFFTVVAFRGLVDILVRR